MRGHRPVAREFIAARAEGNDGPCCVLWPFRLRDGYGVVSTPRPRRRTRPAHQLVLEAAGITQPGWATEVRHLCGNRGCVNLNHLKWGTRSQNQRDRFDLHGDSGPYGERNGRHRLTEEDVKMIRQSNEPQRALAKTFGVSVAAISMAKSGATWSHLKVVAD
jgi:hypothetical protein